MEENNKIDNILVALLGINSKLNELVELTKENKESINMATALIENLENELSKVSSPENNKQIQHSIQNIKTNIWKTTANLNN